MSFTGPGWYLLSTTTDQTISQAMASWGISTSTVYKYMYELKNAPILASPTVQLTADNWVGTDISANPTSLLNPMKAYWVNIQTLIVDMILNGTGTLDNATSPFNGATNVIIQGYTAIGIQAFYGVKNLSSMIIPASVTSIAAQAFYNTPNLSTVTFAANTQLKSSSVQQLTFQKSGLKTVIFESINDLESLGFKIINTPQDFFGANGVQVLPTKAAVQGTLSSMQLQMPLYQNAVTQAQSAFHTAIGAVTTQTENAVKAQQNLLIAQTTLQIAEPEFLVKPSPLIPNGVPNPAYTTAYNNVVSATAALAFAQTQSTAAQATLGVAQILLNQETNSLYNFQGQIDALKNAESFAV